jgi:hypothetical protein
LPSNNRMTGAGRAPPGAHKAGYGMLETTELAQIKNPAQGRVPVLETVMSINTSADQRLGPCPRS